jgi:PBP1b-binding outer membrane lipoprotein LpoB
MKGRLAAVLIAALALAGCGGGESTEDRYKEDFPPLSRQVVRLGQEVGDSIQSASETSSDAQLAADFARHATRLSELQQQIDDLEPPDDLAKEQDRLVSAIGESQGALDEIASAAAKGDPQAASQATTDLIQSSEDLRNARRTLARAVREL